MKRFIATGVLCLQAVLVSAQNTGREPADTKELTTEKRITEKGRDHALWEWIVEEVTPEGDVRKHRKSAVELETGKHYWSAEDNVWKESRAVIKPIPGGAVADEGPQKVIFHPNLNDAEGAVDIYTPDGKRLRGGVLALSYHDAKSGADVVLGLAKDSQGTIVGENQVIYEDAFEGIRADVLYTYSKSGLMQEVVLREQPPTPASLSLDGEQTRLQVLTEWMQLPEGVVRKGQGKRGMGLEDETLDFGAVRIGPGRAFWRAESDEPGSVKRGPAVGKKLIQEGGRAILFESVPVRALQEELEKLPAGDWAKLEVKKDARGWAQRRKPSTEGQYAGLKDKPMLLASADRPRSSGVSVDWSTVTTTGQLTLKSDTTYYVSGSVGIDNLVIEGGTVVKYTNAYAAYVIVYDSLTNLATDYRPAVFTSHYDHGVGEQIVSGGTIPTNRFNTALILYPSAYPDPALTLRNLRFSHAALAISIEDQSDPVTLRDCQFIHCSQAVLCFSPYSELRVFNGLVAGNLKTTSWAAFEAWDVGSILDLQNVTVRTVGTLDGYGSWNTRTDKNCLFIDLSANPGSVDSSSANLYSSSASTVFQPVYFGQSYLQTNSVHRNAGTTSGLDEELLEALTRKTTYAPLLLSNVTVSAVTTFTPYAGRDTDTPDRGYHYDPLDYIFTKCTFNTNVTFAAGTAAAWFQSTSGACWCSDSHGITLANKQKVTFDGNADNYCYWIRATMVQDASDGVYRAGQGGITGTAAQSSYDPSLSPELVARFTRFGALSRDASYYRDYNGYLNVRATHCEMWSGNAVGYILSSFLTNCLMDRVYVGNIYGWFGTSFTLFNGTMNGGTIDLQRLGTNVAYTVGNTAFDQTATNLALNYGNANIRFTNNAYLTGQARLVPTNVNDKVISSFNWQTGPLGTFYLPTNSVLINAGTSSATNFGLYHFTTQTSQTKEGTSIVDIGYHYLSVGGPTNGLLAHWKMEEGGGSTAVDSSGYGHTGTIASTPTRIAGKLGVAFDFDGTDDSISATETSVLRLTNDVTIAFWMRKDTEITGWARMVGKGSTSYRNYGVFEEESTGKRILFQQMLTGGGWMNLYSASQVEVGEWYHITAVRSGTQCFLYIDGVLDASTTVSGGALTSSDPPTLAYDSTHSRFNGALDDVRIYGRALSAGEIAAMAGFGPNDADGDGLSDYQEDLDGDGVVESGETDWTNGSDMGLRVWMTRPRANLPVQ